MKIAIMSSVEAQQKFLEKKHPAQAAYAAMYSSWLGGIVKDPTLMLVPVDDHLVHRGDGVFEALKCMHKRIYLLDEHLDRLQSSAQKIALALPMSRADLKEIILETVRASGLSEAVLRLYLSRGPGTFSPNPYDSVGSQIYLIVTALKALPEEKYQNGVRVGRSQVPPKEKWLAQIKTCNYLPNVMMKKESVDRKLDFTVGFDESGHLTESSTENMILVTSEGVLVHPKLDQILSGTTMNRVFALAQPLVGQEIRKIEVRPLSEEEILSAREVMMAGTTLDILPVTEYENKKIADGKVGPVAKKLLNLLREDIRSGPKGTAL